MHPRRHDAGMPLRTRLALLSASLRLSAAQDVQLLPAGRFSGRDGRPGPGKHWVLDDATGARIAAQLTATSARVRFLFDIDHQTLRAEANGQPAPAAGWATRFEWRRGQGLYALNVTWTDQARAWIESGQYAYISPVITFDDAGRVTGVLMAAITNYPALLGMDPLGIELSARLSALSSTLPPHPQETPDMNLLEQLLLLLGLAAGTTEAAALSAVAALKAQAETPPAKPAPVSAAIAEALGVPASADEAAALSALAALKQPAGGDASVQVIAALQAQVAALSARAVEDEVSQLVARAIADRKLMPVQKQWATELGRKDIAGLKAFIASAPQILPGAGGQSRGVDPASGGVAALSASEQAVLVAMGVKAEDYLKTCAKPA